MKHAVLITLIRAMKARGAVRVIDTHAGAGLYDLESEGARRTGEAEAGVGRLMTAQGLPAPLAALKRLVEAENPGGGVRYYPGSPLVALSTLGPGDAYLGHELRPDDAATLAALLSVRAQGLVVQAAPSDGFASLPARLHGGELVLIDPPYEQGDDYERAAEAVALCLARGAGVALWAPIKDLETFDALVRRIEAFEPTRLLTAEVRLRPLSNPMRMNGSAMVLVNTPDTSAAVDAVCGWMAAQGGEAGARALVTARAP